MINNSYETSSSSSSSVSGSPISSFHYASNSEPSLDKYDFQQSNTSEHFSNYYYSMPISNQINYASLMPTTKHTMGANANDSYSPLDLTRSSYTNEGLGYNRGYYYPMQNQAAHINTPLNYQLQPFQYNESLNQAMSQYSTFKTAENNVENSAHNSPLSKSSPECSTSESDTSTDRANTPNLPPLQASKQAVGKTGSVVNRRRNRTQFSNSQIESLEAIFEKTHYPEVHLVDRLSEKLHLSIERICIWFQNRRAKHKKTKKNIPSNDTSNLKSNTFRAENVQRQISELVKPTDHFSKNGVSATVPIL